MVQITIAFSRRYRTNQKTVCLDIHTSCLLGRFRPVRLLISTNAEWPLLGNANGSQFEATLPLVYRLRVSRVVEDIGPRQVTFTDGQVEYTEWALASVGVRVVQTGSCRYRFDRDGETAVVSCLTNAPVPMRSAALGRRLAFDSIRGRFTLRSQWVNATPVQYRAIRVSGQRVLQGGPKCWRSNWLK